MDVTGACHVLGDSSAGGGMRSGVPPRPCFLAQRAAASVVVFFFFFSLEGARWFYFYYCVLKKECKAGALYKFVFCVVLKENNDGMFGAAVEISDKGSEENFKQIDVASADIEFMFLDFQCLLLVC